jgi:signal transduction histidine kinase
MNTEHLNILLIEDNPGDQRLIREMLTGAKQTKFDVEVAGRLSEGMRYLADSSFDAILLDLSLPDSQGLDTFVALRAAVRETPIVVLSGFDDETTAVHSVQAGAQDYLIKGQVDGQLLIRSLRYAVERGRLERERANLLAKEQAARAEAEAANRTKDEFLAIVSHELRTPLSAILGWSRMIGGGKLDAETFTRAIESIERNAQAQTRLIEDLLDISRITTGKLRLNVRPVELAAVIESAVDAIQQAAEAKGVSLRSTIAPKAGLISADPDRLQQIVWNLLSNAIKFTPRGGRVEIRLGRVGGQIEITVSDTGLGIAPEFLPHVFDSFRQADSSNTRKHGGLGLGLSIVRHLVELHGGTVRADSPGENQGATFTVRFPLLAARPDVGGALQSHAPDATCVAEASAPAIDGVRVLLVDDEADSREVITAMLLQYHAEVLAVASSSAALEAVEKWRPDVMLSDIAMPDGDGISLMRRVRALKPKQGGQIPAAAITAYGRTEDRIRALEAGFQVYLPKPVEPVELAAVVASLAGRTPPPDQPAQEKTE